MCLPSASVAIQGYKKRVKLSEPIKLTIFQKSKLLRGPHVYQLPALCRAF